MAFGAACRQVAHSGCTASEIQAISGHSTLSQVQIYIDEVEQERMADAAMAKLANVSATTSATSSDRFAKTELTH